MVSDGRYKKVQSIQDQCMLAKKEILEKNRGMEIAEILLQDLADKWVTPTPRMLVKQDRRKLLTDNFWTGTIPYAKE